jgi:membrane protein
MMENKIYEKISHWKVIALVIRFSRKLVLPGFDGLSLYNVAGFFVKGLYEGYITSRASAISFNFFLAIFPFLIFLFTIIPFIPIEDFQATLLLLIHDFMPKSAYETVKETVEDIVMRPRGDLLSIGFILAIYFATNGIDSLMEAFNNTYHTIETRSAFRQRLISVLLVFILSFLLIIAIGLMTLGPTLLSLIIPGKILASTFYSVIIWFLTWVIILSTLFLAISFIYYLAPARRRDFRFISAGSSLATLLVILTTLGFNFYVDNFSKYNILYGSIGTLIAVLLWIYFNAISLLIGFELNASIYKAKKEGIMQRNASESMASVHSGKQRSPAKDL